MDQETGRRIVQLLEALHRGQQELRREHQEDIQEARWIRGWLVLIAVLAGLTWATVIVALSLPGAQL